MFKYENFIGKVLDGRYKILELVGTGGMAFVLKAEDLVMNRIVAIKILNDEYNGNEQAETRFINESKAVAMLSHKNIVSIYDVAIYPDMKYIVMEYLDGITLREYLDNKGVLPWKEACVYILQILHALEHAHSKGVIHRDIKPQNVILLKNGEIKVTDFGIAKIPNTPSLTLTEKAIGTVYYISPEQASGKETQFYSDLYSVGVMMYEGVTGKLPFTAESPLSIAMMQVSQEPQNPKEIVNTLPEGVCQIIMKSMQKDPLARFSSAHSMSKAIERILRSPEAVFLMGTSTDEEHKNNPSAVSIDMIDTSEIQNYTDTEIAEVIGKDARKSIKSIKNTNDSKEEEKLKNKKEKAPSRTLFPIISAVSASFLIVALIIGILFIKKVISPGDGGGKEGATYPDIVTQVWDTELRSKLNNGAYGKKFDVKDVIYAENNDFKSGQIISQDPVAGHYSERVEADGDIYFYFNSITVCKKAEDVFVPDVAFCTATEAGVILSKKEYSFNTKIEYENSYDHYEGQVIRTKPDIGSMVKTGDTITVYVCSRTESAQTIPMPDLTGLTKEQAEQLMKYSLYAYVFETVVSPDGEDKVTNQTVAPGTVSSKGTPVTITITKKPDQSSMPDLYGKSQSEVISTILNLGLNLTDYKVFFIAEGDTTPKELTLGLNYENAIQKMIEYGYEEAPDSTEAKVIYQSIVANSTVAKGTDIHLIFGVEP